jgi:xyloglucan-specific exo-beta-1,4-glucanase
MSRAIRRVTCRALLPATALFALALVVWPAHVFAQASYTWRNLQIYGGGFISALADISGFRHNDVNVVPTAQLAPVRGSSVRLDYAELSPSYIVRAANGDTANCEKSLAISTDGGTTWASVSSQPAGLTGGGVVAVSATAGGKIVWSPAGVGVFYTTGGGKTWTASAGIPAGARVAADLVNTNKFYGFKSGTFYVSTDGGKNFTATAATGLPLNGPVRFKAVPGREGDIWLAGGAEWDNTYGLWHSTARHFPLD